MPSADKGLLLRLAEIAIAWLILVAWFWFLRWLYGRLEAKVEHWKRYVRAHATGRNARLKLILASNARGVLSAAFRIAAFLSFILMFPAALTFTLRQFPATHEISDSWINWIKDPLKGLWLGFIEYLPHLGFLIVWIFVVYWFIRLLRMLARWVSEGVIVMPGFHAEWAVPTYRVLVFLTVAFALVVAFPYLPGGESDAFKGVSIFIGILVSLGSGSAIGNAIAGIILIYTRAFKIGDRVKIGDQVGDVMERSMFVTRIRTIKNEDIVIPNGTVMSSYVTNYTAGKEAGGLILYTSITIGYDAPWRTVHRLMIDAALRTEGVLRQPAPFVFQTSLNDYNVAYQINAYTGQPQEMARIYSDLHRHIQDTFNEEGVEILSPMYNNVRDGNRTTIPPQYLSPGYRPPGFRIQP